MLSRFVHVLLYSEEYTSIEYGGGYMQFRVQWSAVNMSKECHEGYLSTEHGGYMSIKNRGGHVRTVKRRMSAVKN